jgi:hypothetical protein
MLLFIVFTISRAYDEGSMKRVLKAPAIRVIVDLYSISNYLTKFNKKHFRNNLEGSQ